MNAPRIARALSLDFPAVADETDLGRTPTRTSDSPTQPPPAKQPRVWQRQPLRAGPLCECQGCKAAEARIAARVTGEFAPGSMPEIVGRR